MSEVWHKNISFHSVVSAVWNMNRVYCSGKTALGAVGHKYKGFGGGMSEWRRGVT